MKGQRVSDNNRVYRAMLVAALSLGTMGLLVIGGSASATHIRPKAATPMFTPMVLAYDQCTSPNEVHAAPLAAGSCAPPTANSSSPSAQAEDPPGPDSLYLKVGNAVNGVPAFGSSGFKWTVIGSPPNDIAITGTVKDVRCKNSLSGGCPGGLGEDYFGELELRWRVKIITHQSGGTITTVYSPYSVAVACAGTAESTPGPPNDVGSTCAVSTTANAVVPGQVSPGQRMIYRVSTLRVYDGGLDALAYPNGDNTLFWVWGIFTN
jgi:hypothetical protein